MSNNMLSTILQKLVILPVETHGVVVDLLTKLNDPEWLASTKRFLRKEDPWPEIVLWEWVSQNAIRVNLDVFPGLPFAGARVERNKGSGWVTVALRDDELYVDGQRVTLYVTEEQKKGYVLFNKLREQLKGQLTLHPNILDALIDNEHLIPRNWRSGGRGDIYICFWSVDYCDSDGNQCVRYLHCRGGDWNSDEIWFNHLCNAAIVAAILES